MFKQIILTPKIERALQNDKHLQLLYKKLNTLHSLAIPIVIEKENNVFVSKFSDEFYEAIERLHAEIEFRIKQVIKVNTPNDFLNQSQKLND